MEGRRFSREDRLFFAHVPPRIEEPVDDPAMITAAKGTPRRSRPASPSPPPRGHPTVLLSVAGLTPQVITETLYCLLVQTTPPADVREVHVLTTRVGAEQVRKDLLRPRDGWLSRFCRDYGIPPTRIRFEPSCIHVPAGAEGKPLEDVRTPDDNARVADAVLALVRDLTRNPRVALHASVAGGRKTMGLFLGIAFQLFARPHDRLSHVLVWPPEIESHPEFFYPPPKPTVYTVKAGTIDSHQVKVELAEIPLLLLRDRLSGLDLEGLSYSALVGRAQQELGRLTSPPALRIHAASRSLRIAGDTIEFTPVQYAVYAILARRRAAGCGRAECAGCSACSLEAKAFHDPAMREELRRLIGELGARDERSRALARWEEAADECFREARAKLNRRIRAALGAGPWIERYCVAASRVAGAQTRYFIPVDPRQIVPA
jgi:CRISPR-associated protein (TIGR02584 family)